MKKTHALSRNVTALFVFGRPPLIFAGAICAIAVMLLREPWIYTLGVIFLGIAMTFDLVDGWFASRFHFKLAHLADRTMDKLAYSILFPLVAVGMMWRFHFTVPEQSKQELVHVIFVLILCIAVLIRDNFAHFMRNFALRRGQAEAHSEINRLRTMVAAPIGILLYAHAFYIIDGPPSILYEWISALGNIPLRVLFFIEIFFLIINLVSIASYCRKYGTYCLDELCVDDEMLRRRILSFFPNSLTLMNALMGGLAIFFAQQSRLREAFLILIGAALFDKLDGALARKLGLTTPIASAKKRKLQITFGGLLDDVADAVSFCIAPAVIFYFVIEQFAADALAHLPYGWVAVIYAVAGILRLTYFTLDQNPIQGFFKGFPTPAAALLVTAPLSLIHQHQSSPELLSFWSQFCFWLMVVTAVLMNFYRIHYIHFGRMMGRNPWLGRTTIVLVVIFVFTPYFGYMGFAYLAIYALSPLITWKVNPELAGKEGS